MTVDGGCEGRRGRRDGRPPLTGGPIDRPGADAALAFVQDPPIRSHHSDPAAGPRAARVDQGEEVCEPAESPALPIPGHTAKRFEEIPAVAEWLAGRWSFAMSI